MTRSTWAFSQSNTPPQGEEPTGHKYSFAKDFPRDMRGRLFRAELERRITANEIRKHEERTAPDEVTHKRVAGVTVISRRLR